MWFKLDIVIALRFVCAAHWPELLITSAMRFESLIRFTVSLLQGKCWFLLLFLFTNFSHAVSRYMGAAITCLAGMSSNVLYWVVPRFLGRTDERKCYSAEQEDSLGLLFEAIVYSRSWVRKSVNRFKPRWCFTYRSSTVVAEWVCNP